ncbi:preprotein translocase subunit SecE [Actinotignum urinale]|uniref:Protein translocase subunit SecE n=1 Tax=Actinotignum urinale TaxID=190146 RepID=A0AAW9HVM1_9ACTO|nr:preprotein translocase subunit SecE [Actinotignum urinale]MDY5129830.1 preprotein translocase subunit SecE [Actinotignum urinale]MDY5132777.1 preprotein translocase subunit SecE [Actinotignum urinale]MDY5150923.1 preprotein translocase subunit SecE [Actinotignum urinale]MDY5154889.1 preprotein translocase subunit SecE [Actinotignum urinale]MDY5159815.1 preprotein translocase subunit SecE [Actinotignum urinale]
MNKQTPASQSSKEEAQKQGIFARLALFFRQIFGELKRVQRPSRKELWQLFGTVVLFIVCIMVFIGVFDLGFGRLTLWVFG